MAAPDRPPDPFSDLELVLPFIESWDDCAIPSIRYYKLQASCSFHGTFVETWDRAPGPADQYLLCLHCAVMGVARKCPLRAVLVCGEGVIPE